MAPDWLVNVPVPVAMMFVAAGEREITPGGGDCAQIEMLPRMLTKTRIVLLLIINLKFVERIRHPP